MSTTRMYHTSPSEITEIYDSDLFGDVLFFAIQPYRMSPSADIVYSMEIPDNEIWTQWELYRTNDEEVCAAIVRAAKELAEARGVDIETATHWLTDEDADHGPQNGWTVQKYLGRLAKYADITCIKSRDEQGTVYIVPMTGKLDKLERVDDQDGE